MCVRCRRGKILLTLEASDALIESYVDGDKTLKGKMLFPMAALGSGVASFVRVDNPKTDGEYIKKLAQENYIVRTYADQYQNGMAFS